MDLFVRCPTSLCNQPRKIIKVSDNNFRKFDDPLGNETPRKYIFYAKTCDVPEGIPMSTNPRDQKLNSTVANAITESLLRMTASST